MLQNPVLHLSLNINGTRSYTEHILHKRRSHVPIKRRVDAATGLESVNGALSIQYAVIDLLITFLICIIVAGSPHLIYLFGSLIYALMLNQIGAVIF